MNANCYSVVKRLFEFTDLLREEEVFGDYIKVAVFFGSLDFLFFYFNANTPSNIESKIQRSGSVTNRK